MSLNILLLSDEAIKERTQIHGNIDPKLIYPHIKYAQDIYIHPVLGTALYDKLLTLVNTDSLAGDYLALVNDFIADALIWYTLAELPIHMSFQFWNKGVLRKQGENTELPSFSELNSLSSEYKNRAEFYSNRLRLYLRQNASNEKFPEYLNPGIGIDTIDPQKNSFTMPVFLGDDERCSNKTFEEKYQGNKNNC